MDESADFVGDGEAGQLIRSIVADRMRAADPAAHRSQWWVLNTGQGPLPPEELQAHFQKERDHYAATTLVAGKDPRDNSTLHVHGYETVLKHIDRAIDSVVVLASKSSVPVFATIRGTTVLGEAQEGVDPGRIPVGHQYQVIVTDCRTPITISGSRRSELLAELKKLQEELAQHEGAGEI